MKEYRPNINKPTEQSEAPTRVVFMNLESTEFKPVQKAGEINPSASEFKPIASAAEFKPISKVQEFKPIAK